MTLSTGELRRVELRGYRYPLFESQCQIYSCVAQLLLGNMELYLHFLSFLKVAMTRLLAKDKAPFIHIVDGMAADELLKQ